MTTPQPAALPELPEPDRTMWQHGNQIDHYTADQMRARDAMWAERLAALQPQPAAAGVSDAEIDWVASQHTRSVDTPTRFVTDVRATVRAILALRPQAVPMTNQELTRIAAESGIAPTYGVCNFGRRVEAHHGITAQGAQGGEG